MLRFKHLSPSNYQLVEKWYEEMSSKGWVIKKIIGSKLHYFKKESNQSKKYKFILINRNEYERFIKSQKEEFIQMEESLGWSYIDHQKQMFLFDSEGYPFLEDTKLQNQVAYSLVDYQYYDHVLPLVLSLYFLYKQIRFLFSSSFFYHNSAIFIMLFFMLFSITETLIMLDLSSYRKNNYQRLISGTDFKSNPQLFTQAITYSFILMMIFLIIILYELFLNSLQLSFELIVRFGILLIIVLLVAFIAKKIVNLVFKESELTNLQKAVTKLGVIIISLVAYIIVFTLQFSHNTLKEVSNMNHDESDNYKTLDTSFWVPIHELQIYPSSDLWIEKSVTKNREIARELIKRKLNEKFNKRVNINNYEIAEPNLRGYDSMFEIDKNNKYIILKDSTVLEINLFSSNSYDFHIIQKILDEVNKWQEPNLTH